MYSVYDGYQSYKLQYMESVINLSDSALIRQVILSQNRQELNTNSPFLSLHEFS